jgi:hypothetical protein
VIEEETGAPLQIAVPSSDVRRASLAEASAEAGGAGSSSDPKLLARDDKKNPLISTFDWTDEATQRIFRVPAGFMRSKTQERIEELARERLAACRAEASGEGAVTIDLALVEEGIEIGKRMMAEMIATYSSPGATTGAATTTASSPSAAASSAPAPDAPSGGYLNEVRSVSASPRQG